MPHTGAGGGGGGGGSADWGSCTVCGARNDSPHTHAHTHARTTEAPHSPTHEYTHKPARLQSSSSSMTMTTPWLGGAAAERTAAGRAGEPLRGQPAGPGMRLRPSRTVGLHPSESESSCSLRPGPPGSRCTDGQRRRDLRSVLLPACDANKAASTGTTVASWDLQSSSVQTRKSAGEQHGQAGGAEHQRRPGPGPIRIRPGPHPILFCLAHEVLRAAVTRHERNALALLPTASRKVPGKIVRLGLRLNTRASAAAASAKYCCGDGSQRLAVCPIHRTRSNNCSWLGHSDSP